jgi:hypothetical protein
MTTRQESGNPKSSKHDELPDAMPEAAAIWYARLREPTSDSAAVAARQADFEGWLGADQRHRRAFAETQRLWDKLDAPVAQVMVQDAAPVPTAGCHRRPATRRLSRPLLLVAACVTLVIAAGLLYQGDLLLWLHSDYRTAIGQRIPLTLLILRFICMTVFPACYPQRVSLRSKTSSKFRFSSDPMPLMAAEHFLAPLAERSTLFQKGPRRTEKIE